MKRQKVEGERRKKSGKWSAKSTSGERLVPVDLTDRRRRGLKIRACELLACAVSCASRCPPARRQERCQGCAGECRV